MSEMLPWCEECRAYSAPNDDGDCGVCGYSITFIESDPE